MPQIKNNNTLVAMLIFLGGVILFTFGLKSEEIIGFESRFYLFAQEMWRNGISLFPTSYNKSYPDYTAASTLCIYFFAKLFGSLNKFTAVLPSAIAAALTLSLTYLIAALHSKRYGFAAVLMLLLTFTFFKSARLITLDLYPTCIAAACFYLVYSADVLKKPDRSWWIFLLLWLGFMFRGPIGLVIPTAVVIAYFAIERNWKKVFTLGFLALFLLMMSTALLLLLARHTGGDAFMQAVLHMQILGRLENHYRPFYFYFLNSLTTYALSFPLTILVLIGVLRYVKDINQADKYFLLKLFGWMLIIILGMSIAGDKKTRYILPMAPAIALIAAYLFNQFTLRYFVVLQRVLSYLFFVFPIMLVVLVEVIYFYAKQHGIDFGIYYATLMVALCILQAVNIAIIYHRWRDKPTQAFYLLITACIAFCITFITAIEPVILYVERGRYLIQAIEQQRTKAGAMLIFFKEEPDSLPIKYLIDMPKASTPIFINDVQALQQLQSPAFIVTREKYFLQLPQELRQRMRILANDTLGHVRVVIFTNTQ